MLPPLMGCFDLAALALLPPVVILLKQELKSPETKFLGLC